ncbi:MAG: DUF4465 domain-containing protein [Aureliella sp.]
MRDSRRPCVRIVPSAHVLSRFALSLAMALVGFASPTVYSHAGVVISSFEEGDLAAKLDAEQTFRGLTAPDGSQMPSDFRSGGATFANDGRGIEVHPTYVYDYWTGVGYAQRVAPGSGQELYADGNDLIAKPASGAGGSSTWAVAYDLSTMTADAGYRFSALQLTNTLYAWSSMALGDPFTPKFTAGDYFTVRFTNPDTSASKDVDLADFRNGNSLILDQWQQVDLSSLGASRLSVSFLGSRANAFGLTTPTYVALDNVAVSSIAAVPEPSSLALLGLGGAIIAWRRRRGRR